MSVAFNPWACRTAINAPTLVPPTRSTSMPAPASASSTPMWANPRASAGENEPDGATGDAASETGQSGVNRVVS